MKRQLINLGRIISGGIKNFGRNLTLAIAAIAVMVITLTIVLFSLITNATFNNTIQAITDKIDVSVFLKDDVSQAQVDGLLSQLKQQPNVASVEYLTKDQALKEFAAANANNPGLIAAAQESGNTLPATIHVKPKNLNQIGDIETFLVKPANKALQTDGSPSYNGDRKKAIDNITHATNVLREFGVGAVILFGLISALIIFNTIQMAIFNRREELQIMRLLGATTWYIRGPFVVESIVYGIVSALVSVGIIDLAFIASSNALQASSLGLLDINYANTYFHANFWQFLTLQVGIGILLGAASSVIATRRYLKFRSRK